MLAIIAKFEQAQSTERVAELLVETAEWLEATGDPVLVSRIRAWLARVLLRRFRPAGRKLEQRLRNEEDPNMATLIERAEQWGEERDRECRREGEVALVRRLVAQRFGSGADEDLAPVLSGISDPDRLAAIAAEVFRCESVAELVDRAGKA